MFKNMYITQRIPFYLSAFTQSQPMLVVSRQINSAFRGSEESGNDFLLSPSELWLGEKSNGVAPISISIGRLALMLKLSPGTLELIGTTAADRKPVLWVHYVRASITVSQYSAC